MEGCISMAFRIVLQQILTFSAHFMFLRGLEDYMCKSSVTSWDSSCEFSLLKYFQKTQPNKINLLSDVLENTSLEFWILMFLTRLLRGLVFK